MGSVSRDKRYRRCSRWFLYLEGIKCTGVPTDWFLWTTMVMLHTLYVGMIAMFAVVLFGDIGIGRA